MNSSATVFMAGRNAALLHEYKAVTLVESSLRSMSNAALIAHCSWYWKFVLVDALYCAEFRADIEIISSELKKSRGSSRG
jgi:hypothetical protein